MKAISFLRQHSLYFAWVIALTGFCLSVFLGEILRNEPCSLCWYQRIALFPLALLLGIAAYRNDAGIIASALPLALFGLAAVLFQILEAHFPILQKAGVCNFGETCAQSALTLFGFLDFPILSAAGFILIAAFLFVGRTR